MNAAPRTTKTSNSANSREQKLVRAVQMDKSEVKRSCNDNKSITEVQYTDLKEQLTTKWKRSFFFLFVNLGFIVIKLIEEEK